METRAVTELCLSPPTPPALILLGLAAPAGGNASLITLPHPGTVTTLRRVAGVDGWLCAFCIALQGLVAAAVHFPGAVLLPGPNLYTAS